MSLVSNNKFIQVFQTIVSVLHSLHHLCGVACNFASACVGCSLSLSNRPDTCNSLHVTNLNASNVVSIAFMHANTSLEVLVT